MCPELLVKVRSGLAGVVGFRKCYNVIRNSPSIFAIGKGSEQLMHQSPIVDSLSCLNNLVHKFGWNEVI
jgi:hypothetical protein